MNSRIFFFHFGSFITAKMSIKERNQGWFRKGGLNSLRAQYIVSQLCEAWRVCCKLFQCCYCGSLHSLSYFGFLFLTKADCNFQRKVLKILYNILFTVAEVVSKTILYHFKEINWIGTHWRGTRRCSPVKGVNSVINFCL